MNKSSSEVSPQNMSLLPDVPIGFLEHSYESQNACYYELDFIFWILNGVIGLAILLGNSFTVAVFLSTSHMMDNYMNIYLTSLSFADMSMALLVVPGFAAFCSGCSYKLSEYCWFFGGARDIAFPATVLNLLAITYDRHSAVLRPLHYASTMTRRKVFTILIFVWFTPLVVSSVRNAWQHSMDETAVKRYETVYNAILSVLFTFSPIPILFFVNIKLMRTIRSHRSRIHADMVESLTLTNASERGLSEGNRVTVSDANSVSKNIRERNHRNISRRRKGTMSCVLIVLIFIISWLPRAFFNFCSLFGRSDLASPLLRKLSLFFIFCQSSVNPIIYSFFRNDFRQAARRLIKRIA